MTLGKGVTVLIAALLISTLGDNLASFSMILEAAESGVPVFVTELFLAELVPPIIFAALFSHWLDRYPSINTIIWGTLIQSAAFASGAALNNFHFRVAMIAIAGAAGVATAAAIFKWVPQLVSEGLIGKVNSGLVTVHSLGFLIGPPLAGLIRPYTGTGPLLAGNSATFLVLVGLCMLLRMRSDVGAVPSSEAPLAKVGAGIRAMRKSRLVWCLVPALAGIVLSTSIEGVAGVFYLREVADSDFIYALMLSSWAVGSIIGSIVGGFSVFDLRSPVAVLGGGLIVGAALIFEALVPMSIPIIAAFVLGGFGNGIHNVGVRNLVHRNIGEESHGSAWAYYSAMTQLCIGLGYIGGTPGIVLDAQSLILGSGLLCVAVVFIGAIRVHSFTRLGVR